MDDLVFEDEIELHQSLNEDIIIMSDDDSDAADEDKEEEEIGETVDEEEEFIIHKKFKDKYLIFKWSSTLYDEMGNGMNKVLPGLYIGNFRDAKDEEQLKQNEITHIIAVHDNAKPAFEHISYKCIDIPDDPSQNLMEHFKECINFIHNARKNDGNVLVHCIAGISRSCTICAAYILVITQLGWEDAISAIRVARKVVNPNYGFQKQLQAFHVLDAIKIRESLVRNFGELNSDDEKYLLDALKNCDRDSTEEGINEGPSSLGTTGTFGNYERKKKGDETSV